MKNSASSKCIGAPSGALFLMVECAISPVGHLNLMISPFLHNNTVRWTVRWTVHNLVDSPLSAGQSAGQLPDLLSTPYESEFL